MSRSLFGSLSLAVWASLALSTPATAQPTITNLDVLGGGAASYAYAISADGLVVTGQSASSSGYRAFRWTQGGGMQSLNVLPSFAASSLGTAINADGSVITGSSTGTGNTARAFRWTAAIGIESIGVLETGSASYGNAISADGSVIVGGSYASGFNGSAATQWTAATGMHRLLPAPSGEGGVALGIGANGSTVAGALLVDGYYRAFRWTESGGLQDLSVLSGADSAFARAISSDGATVVGDSGDQLNATYTHAFRWTAGGIQDLGVLGASSHSYANAVSSDGSVVVGTSALAASDRAILWTHRLGMVDLNTYLPSLGVSLTGWILNAANGVSADGSAIVGYGEFNGSVRAFLVRGLPVCRAACPADFNCSGGAPSVSDIFAFLTAWFAGNVAANFDGIAGVTVGDIFAFLTAWFAGCP